MFASLYQLGLLEWLPITICFASVAPLASKKPAEPFRVEVLPGRKNLSLYVPDELLLVLVKLEPEVIFYLSAAACSEIRPVPIAVATAAVKATLPATDETVVLQDDLPFAGVISATATQALRS